MSFTIAPAEREGDWCSAWSSDIRTPPLQWLKRIYSAASAGVSLTFINPASSVVLGYDLDLGSSGKLDLCPVLFLDNH
jgi:hypothetical protein